MAKMFRIIIAGGRKFKDYELLCSKMAAFTENVNPEDIEIVSGVARGADQLGERWAAEGVIPVKHFPADWGQYGKSAGYKRNEDMARYATHLVAFWDGKSRGTEHMIQLAEKVGLEVRVVRY